MPGWSGKSKGGTFGYRFFIFLIRKCGLGTTYFFVRIVALYYFLFTGKSAMRYYFRQILGMGRWRTMTGIYKNFCLMGEVLVDKVAMLSGARTDFTFEFEGEEHLRRMSRMDKGGILVGAHMGNWEVAGQLLERIDTPVNIVMLDAEREAIRDLLNQVMVRRKVRVIPQAGDYSHLFRMEEALERKEFLVLHGDRFLPGANTVTVPFMGRPARFPAGPLYLASKRGVPVSFVFTMKEGRTHYHFYATPPKVYSYPSRIRTRKEEVRSMVGDYVQALEGMVRKYPFQWFNYYAFWEN